MKLTLYVLFFTCITIGCNNDICKETPFYIYSYRTSSPELVSYTHILTFSCENPLNIDSTFLHNVVLKYKDTCSFDLRVTRIQVISHEDEISFITNEPDHLEIEKRKFFDILFNEPNHNLIDSIFFKKK
jgi:hypothetical protein